MNSDLTEIVWKKKCNKFYKTNVLSITKGKKKILLQIFIYYGVKMTLTIFISY